MSAFRKARYPLPVDPAAVRADHPGFTFGTFNDPPGRAWENFVHDTDEFVVVAEGEIAIEVAGETQTCGPGDLVLIPAGARHSLRTSPAAGSRWHYGYGHRDESDG